jgi:hypothetical protein
MSLVRYAAFHEIGCSIQPGHPNLDEVADVSHRPTRKPPHGPTRAIAREPAKGAMLARAR